MQALFRQLPVLPGRFAVILDRLSESDFALQQKESAVVAGSAGDFGLAVHALQGIVVAPERIKQARLIQYEIPPVFHGYQSQSAHRPQTLLDVLVSLQRGLRVSLAVLFRSLIHAAQQRAIT